jgi:serine/threonine protein phosphatase PrpC
MGEPDKRLTAAKMSRRGSRSINQDRSLFLSSAETVLLCLADGLGGHPRGEVAAQLLMDVTEARFRASSKPLSNPEQFMLQCIGQAHDAILRFGRRQSPTVAPRTTAVIAVIQNGIAYWVHVGDSRLYLVRDGQALVQTRDHTQVRFIRQSAEEHPRPCASLTRCLGGLPQPPTTTCGVPTPLRKDDGLLLCSDGLWNQISQHELLSLFAPGSALETQLEQLVDRAASDPASDNVTALALRWLVDDVGEARHGADATPKVDAALEQAIENLQQVLTRDA